MIEITELQYGKWVRVLIYDSAIEAMEMFEHIVKIYPDNQFMMREVIK